MFFLKREDSEYFVSLQNFRFVLLREAERESLESSMLLSFHCLSPLLFNTMFFLSFIIPLTTWSRKNCAKQVCTTSSILEGNSNYWKQKAVFANSLLKGISKTLFSHCRSLTYRGKELFTAHCITLRYLITIFQQSICGRNQKYTQAIV